MEKNLFEKTLFPLPCLGDEDCAVTRAIYFISSFRMIEMGQSVLHTSYNTCYSCNIKAAQTCMCGWGWMGAYSQIHILIVWYYRDHPFPRAVVEWLKSINMPQVDDGQLMIDVR